MSMADPAAKFVGDIQDNQNCAVSEARNYARRNLYGISIGFVVTFSSFVGLQNLQSSINSSGGLGLVSMSILYIFFILAGFVSPGIIKIVGTKVSILIGFSCHLVYIFCNYYPSWYTLVPGSILIGIASAPLWASASSILAKVAKEVAPSLGEDRRYLISKFTAIFFFIFQFSQIPGNLVSSLILFPYNTSERNFTLSDELSSSVHLSDSNGTSFTLPRECRKLESTTMETKYLYGIVSVYAFFVIAGLLIVACFVDRFPTEDNFFSSEQKFRLYIKKPFIDLLTILHHKHMLLIATLSIANGAEMAFAFGSFTEHLISDCFGTYMVGFMLILLGMSSAAMSLAYSKLVKCIPRFAIVLFGASLNIGLIIFLLIWERVPSYAFICSFAVIWGVADAIWNTVPTSLTGILFADCSEVAYSALRIWLASGFCIGFTTAKFLSVEGQLWMLFGFIVSATVCELMIEFSTQTKQELCMKWISDSEDIEQSAGEISK